MGLINTALQIGRGAISSYQSALSVVGNNIANAADPDYTRQRAVLEPRLGAALPEGARPGGGVTLTSIERILNESLESRLRDASGQVEQARVESQILRQIESSLNELTDSDLSSLMNGFFNSFNDVQNDATEVGLRSVVLGNAEALAGTLRTRRSELESMTEEVNNEIIAAATQADELAQRVADLNIEVVAAEANGHVAGALRDQRDAVLRELSEIIEITVRPHEGGTVSVFVGNEVLVQFGTSRGLTAEPKVEDAAVRYELRFRDNAGQVDVRGGLIGGLYAARDGHIVDMIATVDQLAEALITGVNEVHVNGQGLEGFNILTGNNTVPDVTQALNEVFADGSSVPQSGSFFISMTDVVSGRHESYQIEIDLDGVGGDDTTLTSLVADLNATVANLTAVITPDNRINSSTTPGFTFSFGHDGISNREDTSQVLTALGVNTFFEGTSAADIQVNSTLLAKPEWLAAASVPLAGDGVNAGLLADVRQTANRVVNNVTLSDFYNQMIVDTGITTSSAEAVLASADNVRATLQAQRASISGVNLDEEAVDLLRYERAFQGSARYTSIVDQLIAEMLNIVR